MTWLELGLGLMLLLAGGEGLVRGGAGLAARLGVPPLVIGLTVLGFGTSTPELVASLRAALSGSPGIALGNVVGSNIANIALILGLTALLAPIAVGRRAFHRDGAVMIASSLALAGLCISGTLGRTAGLALIAGLVLYTWVSFRHPVAAPEASPPPAPLWSGLLMLGLGLAGVVGGATLLVDSAVTIARDLGLSEAIIGLTLVAVGTSLPELATSVLAALRRQPDLAFGNIIGSNIFNILGIVGLTAVTVPLAVPAEILGFDLWVMLATAVVLAGMAASGWRLSRLEGLTLLGGYALYLGALFALPGLT
jgi:cation:H+ antiporter